MLPQSHVAYQTSHEVLGYYVVCNVTKFQSCRPNNQLFIDEKPLQKHFAKNTIQLNLLAYIESNVNKYELALLGINIALTFCLIVTFTMLE